jgi:hypothetical protein
MQTYSVIDQNGFWTVLRQDQRVASFADRGTTLYFLLAAVERGCAEGKPSTVLVHHPHGPEHFVCPSFAGPPPGIRLRSSIREKSRSGRLSKFRRQVWIPDLTKSAHSGPSVYLRQFRSQNPGSPFRNITTDSVRSWLPATIVI